MTEDSASESAPVLLTDNEPIVWRLGLLRSRAGRWIVHKTQSVGMGTDKAVAKKHGIPAGAGIFGDAPNLLPVKELRLARRRITTRPTLFVYILQRKPLMTASKSQVNHQPVSMGL